MTQLDARAAGDAEVIAALAEIAAGRTQFDLDDDRVAFVLAHGQTVHEVDLSEYRERPARKTGSVTLADAGSFILYTSRHLDVVETTLWSDYRAGTMTAVLNDHGATIENDAPGAAAWGDHRATLRLVSTPEWDAWLAGDGRLMAQVTFAEHLENLAHTIADPPAADMLEIAQTFHAKTGVAFKSSQRLSSGEVQLQYEETTQAHAGSKGSVDIPTVFGLRFAPFDGSQAYELGARFRYRIKDGQLHLGYKLIQPEQLRKQAFDDLTHEVSERLGLEVMAGTPRS